MSDEEVATLLALLDKVAAELYPLAPRNIVEQIVDTRHLLARRLRAAA